MKKMAVVLCSLMACLLVVSGCLCFIKDNRIQAGKPRQHDVNLSVKIDIEKNGAIVDHVSSLTSQDEISVSNVFQEKQEDGSNLATIWNFSGKNITKVSEDTYSMDYKLSLKVPITNKTSSGTSTQYQDEGSASSVKVKLGQPVGIYENNTYKVKMTIDAEKAP